MSPHEAKRAPNANAARAPSRRLVSRSTTSRLRFSNALASPPTFSTAKRAVRPMQWNFGIDARLPVIVGTLGAAPVVEMNHALAAAGRFVVNPRKLDRSPGPP